MKKKGSKLTGTAIKQKDTATSQYLQQVSQSIYNLRKIIDAHLIEPIGEDKDLNSFYLEEIDTLYKLLRNPVEQSVISGEYIRDNLSRNLMFNRGKTESAQKELDRADDCIRIVLGKVQSMRRKHYGSSVPTQGLEEGPLKLYLADFLTEKQTRVETVRKPKLKIEYTLNLGQLVFNGKSTVEISGIQKDVMDCLIEAEGNGKVSWDAIYEEIQGTTYIELNKHETILAKKSINGAVSEINKKTERYLEEGKLLIEFKDNEYWLQYEIDIDG